MRTFWQCASRFLALAAGFSLLSCDGGGGGGSRDYSGTYWVAIGHTPRYSMDVKQSGNDVTFEVSGAGLAMAGTGSLRGKIMTIQADLPGLGPFSAALTFAGGGERFSGSWEIPDVPVEGTIAGSREPWSTWDVEADGIPRFAVEDCIDLDAIERLSRFRSGEGHDYSDDFESCRSMKHYFYAKPGVDMATIRLYSPVTGEVVGTTEEYEGPDLWKGTAIGIRPDGYPAFHMVFFHVDLAKSLRPGDRVRAGDLLGTSEKISGTATDLAFGVHTPAGFKLVSHFEVMTDSVFGAYSARGVATREEAIITRAERDADPLTCDGDQFLGPGALENWVYLD